VKSPTKYQAGRFQLLFDISHNKILFQIGIHVILQANLHTQNQITKDQTIPDLITHDHQSAPDQTSPGRNTHGLIITEDESGKKGTTGQSVALLHHLVLVLGCDMVIEIEVGF
jgi:hypothetical protein